MSFYIKTISAYGSGKKTSVINLQDGLNIIYGPSNTGKTYIVNTIDFLFGAKDDPMDRQLGYTKVSMDIVTDKGYEARLERELGKNKISVTGNIPDVENKEYTTKKIDDVLLSLIGIDEEIKVIKSRDFDIQALTWKTIRKMFVIDEQRISSDSSIIVSQGFKNITAALSSLLFLIDGQKQHIPDEREKKAIKEAKKTAVTKYIKEQIASLSDMNKELEEKLNMNENSDLEAEMERIMAEIKETDKKISDAMSKTKKILKEIFDLTSQIEEDEFLAERYRSLESQYLSDIKRLEFIINGEAKQPLTPKNSKCPFCDSSIKEHSHQTYTKASESEIERIKLMLDDLRETMASLSKELEANKQKLAELESEHNEIENLINEELKPHTDRLKASLEAYSLKQQIIGDMSRIKKFADKMTVDMHTVENDESLNLKYDVKNHFEKETIDTLNQYLDEMLKACCFPEYLTSGINMTHFDVTVNARAKRIEGQGYRSFINTIFAFVLMKYLSANASHAPKLLIIDSPIMALTERESDNSDSMKSALFSYLANNQNYGQVIIAENEIPDVDYGNAKLIKFSGINNKGRYGFLENPN